MEFPAKRGCLNWESGIDLKYEPFMHWQIKLRTSLLTMVLCILCVSAVQACPVCFGAKDAPVNQASVQAIGVPE